MSNTKVAILIGTIMSFAVFSFDCFEKNIEYSNSTKLTWSSSYVFVPAVYSASGHECYGKMEDAVVKSCFERAKLNSSNTVVVYSHGCDGMNASALKLLREIGTFYVAPDSMKRPNRPTDCGIQTDKKDIVRLRVDEIANAIQNIRMLVGLKSAKIVVIGFSEGAVASALYSDTGIDGRIILGWTCHSYDSWYNGIRGDNSIPMLAIVGSNDPYYQNSSNKGNCIQLTSGNSLSKSIVEQGVGHNVLYDPTTRTLIQNFLNSISALIVK